MKVGVAGAAVGQGAVLWDPSAPVAPKPAPKPAAAPVVQTQKVETASSVEAQPATGNGGNTTEVIPMEMNIGENVTVEVNGDTLVIKVPNTKATGRPSSTGKSTLIATTKGYARFGNLGVSLNVTKTVPAA